MALENITNSLVSVELLPNSHTPVVSSLQLADHFGIKHSHVLRDIRAILNKLPQDWRESNFGLSSQIVAMPNNAEKEAPVYLLTRDGFTLLAMGYNSARAIQWKLRYIEAFNSLERAVLQESRQAALLEGMKTALALSSNEQLLLQKVVNYRRRGLTQTEIAKLTDVHRIQVGHLLSKAKKLGLLPDAAQKPGRRKEVAA